MDLGTGPLHQRLVGQDLCHRTRSGGLGAFTPDSFPVFDTMRDNAYLIADSNHGYKMMGVGGLVANEVLGKTQELLEPFRFSRYPAGNLHPVSNSPYPGGDSRASSSRRRARRHRRGSFPGFNKNS